MKYTQATFSIPVSGGKATQTEYEVAVGLRCHKCLNLMDGHGPACPVPQTPIGA